MTKVIFRKFKDDGSIIALFPDLAGTSDLSTCMSYMHVGQHSSASASLSSKTVAAKPAEYKALLAELKQLGYDDLKIALRFTHKDLEQRREQCNVVAVGAAN